MTPEAQRIAIAEACGWEWIADEGEWCHARKVADPYGMPPDYLRDLNAMHEAEKVLLENSATWTRYVAELKLQSAKSGLPHFHLEPAQRAKAFLQTLNLWTE